MRFIKDTEAIISLVGPGATVVLHSGCAEPTELARRVAAQVRDVNLITFMPMGSSSYAACSGVHTKTFFPGKGLRKAVASGQAELLRYPLSSIPSLFRDRKLTADFLFLKVSPPDEHGRMTLGVSVDYMRSVLDQRPVVVAEIDPRMPRTHGDTTVLPEQIEYVLDSLDPPQVIDPGPPSDVDRKIADNVAGLVGNGAVIQTGIGALPDLVLGNLVHLRDLGIHTGIVTDAMVPLLNSGAITNANKTRFNGKCVTTVAAGSRALYDFLNDNAEIEFHPCSLTHDGDLLASIDNLCAINSVLEVDLAGRCNAERVDGRIIAGPGGLPDFAAGASRSKGGMSIVALRSTSPDGRRSNICVELGADAPVSIDGSQVDYVVTEYGVARIRSLSSAERARALIAVAHPDWRRNMSIGTAKATSPAN